MLVDLHCRRKGGGAGEDAADVLDRPRAWVEAPVVELEVEECPVLGEDAAVAIEDSTSARRIEKEQRALCLQTKIDVRVEVYLDGPEAPKNHAEGQRQEAEENSEPAADHESGTKCLQVSTEKQAKENDR